MNDTPDRPVSRTSARTRRPLRAIREIREWLECDEIPLNHFDTELGTTEFDKLAAMLHRWTTLGQDGFQGFLLSQPFLGLKFGGRS